MSDDFKNDDDLSMDDAPEIFRSNEDDIKTTNDDSFAPTDDDLAFDGDMSFEDDNYDDGTDDFDELSADNNPYDEPTTNKNNGINWFNIGIIDHLSAL